jgi:3-dehydroquinate dehydratase II
LATGRTILVLNGPNLNLLGTREPAIYGPASLADIEEACRRHSKPLGFELDFRQSNHEGQLIDWIQAARGQMAGIVINPGGLSHSSIALLDALLAVGLPVVEVHLSNIFKRESYRRHSFVSEGARGVICGLGPQGYLLALDALAEIIGTKKDA